MARREDVTVSFHYLKYLEDPNEPDSARPFTEAEFAKLLLDIEQQIAPDMGDKLTFERVRSGAIIPFYDFEKKGKRCAFGRFKAPYSGHAFDNSDHGKVEAGSVNQRMFNYMLYQTKDGRIFAGAQYLGNYGGWGHLSNGLKSFFDQKNKIQPTSIRNQGYVFEKVFPREIKIRISKKPGNIEGSKILTKEQVITLHKGQDGQNFEREAKNKILSLLKKPLNERGAELKKVLISAGLQEFNDYDIEDCVVVADIHNGSKSYHIFENGLRATRFHLDVPLDIDGHPEMLPTRDEMLSAFKEYILKEIAEDCD